MIVSIVVMYNRYYYRYHTVEQIMVGGVIGIGLGVLAFYLCRCVFLTNFVKKDRKKKQTKKKSDKEDDDEKEEDDNSKQQNSNGPVQQGTVIDSIGNRKAQEQGEVERNMQRMGYDFHSEQVNDYVNNLTISRINNKYDCYNKKK